jgi:hypothetical protein
VRKLLLLLFMPICVGFDGEHAREALDQAFHNLYGSDVLAGVELVVEDGAQRSGFAYAYGRKRSGAELRTLVYAADGDRDSMRALLFQRPGEADRIFLAEGSVGRVRAVSAARSGAPFFGSDFSYEDMRAKRADDFRIEVLGEDTVDGEPCRVLRLRPFEGPYEKLVVWLSTARPVLVRIDYFDRHGLWKRYRADVRSLSEQFEWWVPMRDQMLDLRTGRRTRRHVRNIIVDAAVPDEMFTTTQLARGRLPAF